MTNDHKLMTPPWLTTHPLPKDTRRPNLPVNFRGQNK